MPLTDLRSANCASERPPTAPLSIGIADRRALWRYSLETALASHWEEVSVSSFDTLSTERAADLDAITAMLLLGSAGLASNAELRDDLGRIKKSMPGAPVLVITDEFDWDDVSVAMQLGAKGYLASSVSVDLLIQCLRLLMIGGTAFPAVVSTSTASHTSESPPPPQSRPENNLAIDLFTSREIEVLASLGEGKPNKIIAYELNICETTVKVHMRHIMRKLGAANRTQAALLASEMVRA